MNREKTYRDMLSNMKDRMTKNERETFEWMESAKEIGQCFHCGYTVYVRRGCILSDNDQPCYCNGRKQ